MDFNIETYKYISLLPIAITTLPAGEYRKFIYQTIGGVLFLDSYNIAYNLGAGIISSLKNSYNYLTYTNLEESIIIIHKEANEFIGDLKEDIL